MQKLKIVLIIVVVFLCIAALKTAIPAEEASKACLLGYKAYCSFTPISTLMLALAAVGTYFAAKKFNIGGAK